MKVKATIFGAVTLSAVALTVAGFIVPPTGVIDPSVLTALGELFAFAALAQLPSLIKSRGAKITTKGGTTIEVSDDDDNDNSDKGDEMDSGK